jgi:hypothetical protein
MNLYGWSFQSFTRVLGSKDAGVLNAATVRLREALRNESSFSRGTAWLRTLIDSRFPLRQDREPPLEPADGGLVTVQMETGFHAIVVYCLARAIAREDHLDLARESSHWDHPAVGALYWDVAACGFTRLKSCGMQYFTWMSKLSHGSPLFGDDFRTQWSFYSCFSNEELAAMIPVFRAAAEYSRPLPEGFSEEALKQLPPPTLSAGGKRFIGDLIKWFGQIQQAGQEAFIVWW